MVQLGTFSKSRYKALTDIIFELISIVSEKVIKVLVEWDDVIRMTKFKIKRKCSESPMQGEKMIGNDNVRRKSARNRQCKVKECWETTKYAEKCSESSMQSERMPGNDKVC